MVLVEPLLDGTRGDLERFTARRYLDGLEVDSVCCARTDQRLDLGGDFTLEDFFEAPFFAVSPERPASVLMRASQRRSLISTSSRIRSRNL